MRRLPKKQQNRIELSKYLNQLITTSRKSPSAKYRLKSLLTRLRQFERESSIHLYSDSFNTSLLEEFVYFLKHCTKLKGDKTKCYRHNNVCHFIKTLRGVLNRLQKEDCDVDKAFTDFTLKEEEGYSVYLTQEELCRISALKLRSKEAEAVRDIFLLGCYTAQRFSDYSRITVANNFDFKRNVITVKTVKTGTQVITPIHPEIHEILNRNKGVLPALHSLQAFNKCIKRICKRAGIVDSILIEYTEGAKTVRRKVAKYTLVSSHTARRTGATLMYLACIPIFRIMLLTGHKTEEAFFRYIRIRREENAKELQDNLFFKK